MLLVLLVLMLVQMLLVLLVLPLLVVVVLVVWCCGGVGAAVDRSCIAITMIACILACTNSHVLIWHRLINQITQSVEELALAKPEQDVLEQTCSCMQERMKQVRIRSTPTA